LHGVRGNDNSIMRDAHMLAVGSARNHNGRILRKSGVHGACVQRLVTLLVFFRVIFFPRRVQLASFGEDDLKRGCTVCSAKSLVADRVSFLGSEVAALKLLVPKKRQTAGTGVARFLGFAALRCRGCCGMHVPSIDGALITVDATTAGVKWAKRFPLRDFLPHWRRVVQHAMVPGVQFEQPCPATLSLDGAESFFDVVAYAMTWDDIVATSSRAMKTPTTRVLSPSAVIQFGSVPISGKASSGALPATFDTAAHSSNVELSEGDSVARSTSGTNCYAAGSIGFKSGTAEWTFKISKDSMNDECSCVGVCSRPVEGESYDSSKQMYMIRAYNGCVYSAGTSKATVRKLHQDELLAFRLDMSARTVSLQVNGEDVGVVFDGIEGDEIFPAVAFYSSDRAVTFVDLHGAVPQGGRAASVGGVVVSAASPAHYLKVFVLNALHSAVSAFGAAVTSALVSRGAVRYLLDFVDVGVDDTVAAAGARSAPKSWEDVDVSAVAPAQLAAAILLRMLDVALLKSAVDADVGSQLDLLRLVADCEKLAAVSGADVSSTKLALVQNGAIQAVLSIRPVVSSAADVAAVVTVPVVQSVLHTAVVSALARLLSWIDNDPRLAAAPVTQWFSFESRDAVLVLTDHALVTVSDAPPNGVSKSDWEATCAAEKRCSVFCASLLQKLAVSPSEALAGSLFEGGYVARWSAYVLDAGSKANPEARCAIASALLQLFDAQVLISSMKAVLGSGASATVAKRFVDMATICGSLDEYTALAEVGMRSAVTNVTQAHIDETKASLLKTGIIGILLRVYRKLTATADQESAAGAAMQSLGAAFSWIPSGTAYTSLLPGALPGEAGAWSAEEWCATLVRLSLAPSSGLSSLVPAFEAGTGYSLSTNDSVFNNSAGNIAIPAVQGISSGTAVWSMRLITDTNSSGTWSHGLIGCIRVMHACNHAMMMMVCVCVCVCVVCVWCVCGVCVCMCVCLRVCVFLYAQSAHASVLSKSLSRAIRMTVMEVLGCIDPTMGTFTIAARKRERSVVICIQAV
jgi:SPRY domain